MKTTAQPQVTGNFLTCPGRDSKSDSGERELAVSDNALDHTVIRAGPTNKHSVVRCNCNDVKVNGNALYFVEPLLPVEGGSSVTRSKLTGIGI